MAARKVTYSEWVENGKYPNGTSFNPQDSNLRSYYDTYSSQWDAGGEALRAQLNTNHGLSAWNTAAVADDDKFPAWEGRHAPSAFRTGISEVTAAPYARQGLLNWSQYMPQQLETGPTPAYSYLDPMALQSQRGIAAPGLQGRYYQSGPTPAIATGGRSLWEYAPPTTSLFGGWPAGATALSIPPASSFFTPEDDETKKTKDNDTGDDEDHGEDAARE